MHALQQRTFQFILISTNELCFLTANFLYFAYIHKFLKRNIVHTYYYNFLRSVKCSIIDLDEKIFPDWFFCFHKHVCVPDLSDLILEKPSQFQEFSFSLFVGRSKHSGIEAGRRSLFKLFYLFRKLGTKLW